MCYQSDTAQDYFNREPKAELSQCFYCENAFNSVLVIGDREYCSGCVSEGKPVQIMIDLDGLSEEEAVIIFNQDKK